MMPQAISKLRRSFILVATASFIAVILIMGLATYAVNVISVQRQANATIDAILDANGNVPTEENYHTGSFQEEASYGLRFFTVSFNDKGEITAIDVSHVALITEEDAELAAAKAANPDTLEGLGRHGTYFYKEGQTDSGSMIVFLDCAFQIETMSEVTTRTLTLCLVVAIVTLACVVFFSKRAIRPEVENARRQQQFMTNAGHELKTPIAVIRANTEVTEMISGETEWTRSTLAQVDRLEGLVSDLMTIVRGEEKSKGEQSYTDVDVTAVTQKAVDSFKSVAQQRGIELQTELAEGASLHGSEATVEQLCCLLVDNAIKYCDEEGTVMVKLAPARIGHGCTLAVSNNFVDGADVDYQRFFERFYREDESHENQQGYGIGLSVAESICKRYHGSIKATWKAGRITFTCVLKDI